MKKHTLARGLSATAVVLTGLAIALSAQMFQWSGSVNAFLGIESGSISGEGNMVYQSDYGTLSDENLAKLVNDEKAFCKREMEEGAVLLKNDGTLPLASTIKNVTLFGHASVDTVYKSHAGGGVVSSSTAINLKTALEGEGFSINETMYNAYKNSSVSRVKGSTEGTSVIGEEDQSFYTSDIKNSFSNYKDAAIVVLARDSGEGQDFNLSDSEGLPQLRLHQAEKDLLQMIKDAGFSKIIVLLNGGNAVEVEEIKAYGVNSIMWIGEPGRYGMPGVASLLRGKANPSGHLADTYATSSISSPAMANWGDFTFSGDTTNAMANKYVCYAEGIYTGYKYYETRYEDCILNQGNAASTVGTYASSGAWNYAQEVSYPFGYGLSYTTFEQTLDSFEYNSASDQYVAKVTVKNKGSVAGKSVVELYMQSPYTDYDRTNAIEKSAVQVVGFEKTKDIEPGNTETVTITVDRYLTASYDSKSAKGYVLDAGNWYFSIGDNAHDALNNILAAKGATGMYDLDGNSVTGNGSKAHKIEISTLDTTSYKKSHYTDATVTNQFTGDYAIDVNDFYDNDPVTYLTRNHWDTTYPTSGVTLEMNTAIEKAEVSRQYTQSGTGLTDDQKNGVTLETPIKFYEMHGVDYNDAKWETFLSQLGVEDMSRIISDSLGQEAVSTVGKPANKNADGPDGYGMNYRYGDQDSPTCYNIENLSVSSWSKEIMKLRGNFYGEDCIYSRGQMAWGPGLDLHRTPYGGRNFEYGSEDGLFNGLMLSVMTKAMNAKGVIASPKHLFGNEQETNRSGACTFMTEQTARECNLRSFELPYTVGECGGSMLAMNRIGCKMSPVAKTTLTNICREEWGWNGILVTDSSGSENDRIPTVDSLISGTGMFCLARRSKVIKEAVLTNDDPYMYNILKETNHRFYYWYANSTLVNGLGENTVVSNTIAWWQPTVIIIDCVLGAAALGAAAWFVYDGYFKKEKVAE